MTATASAFTSTISLTQPRSSEPEAAGTLQRVGARAQPLRRDEDYRAAHRFSATILLSSGRLNASTAQLVAAAEIQESRPCGNPLSIVGWKGNARRRTYHVPFSNWVCRRKRSPRSIARCELAIPAPTRNAYRAWPVA